MNEAAPVRDDPSRLEPVDPYLAANLLVNLAAEFPVFSAIGDWRELTKGDITPEIVRVLNMVTHRRKFLGNCEVSLSWQRVVDTDTTAAAVNAFLSPVSGSDPLVLQRLPE